MDDTHVVWDLEDDPDGNVRHIQERGITMDEVEDVLLDRDSQTAVSKSNGEPITFGHTASGQFPPREVEPLTMRPLTADEVPEPGRRTPQRRKR